MERAKSPGLVAAGLLAGLVLASLTTADAQSPTPTPSPRAEAPRGDRKHGRDLRGALHGEVTVRRDGGYATYAGQRGTLLALTPASLTVRSEDGFSRTYVRTADTKVGDGVEVGDTVRVMALVENGSARALHVREGRARRT